MGAKTYKTTGIVGSYIWCTVSRHFVAHPQMPRETTDTLLPKHRKET